jgi:hypothetical protein
MCSADETVNVDESDRVERKLCDRFATETNFSPDRNSCPVVHTASKVDIWELPRGNAETVLRHFPPQESLIAIKR